VEVSNGFYKLLTEMKKYDSSKERVIASVSMCGVSFVLTEYECQPGDEYFHLGLRILYRQYLGNGEVNVIPSRKEISFVDLIDALRAQEKEIAEKRMMDSAKAYAYIRQINKEEYEKWEQEQKRLKEEKKALLNEKRKAGELIKKEWIDEIESFSEVFLNRASHLPSLSDDLRIVLLMRALGYQFKQCSEAVNRSIQRARQLHYKAIWRLCNNDSNREQLEWFLNCFPEMREHARLKEMYREPGYQDKIKLALAADSISKINSKLTKVQ
jgi:actin-related protein